MAVAAAVRWDAVTAEAGYPLEAPHLFHGDSTAALQKPTATSQ